jgi:hypothetical protein
MAEIGGFGAKVTKNKDVLCGQVLNCAEIAQCDVAAFLFGTEPPG